MPTHREKRFLPYTPEQIFDLVADVERYPEFLPWCVGARIRKREDDVITADLMIGFKMIRERYTARGRSTSTTAMTAPSGIWRTTGGSTRPMAAARSISISISSSARACCNA